MKCFFCEIETETGHTDVRGLFACEECFLPWIESAWNEATEKRNTPEYREKVKRVFSRHSPDKKLTEAFFTDWIWVESDGRYYTKRVPDFDGYTYPKRADDISFRVPKKRVAIKEKLTYEDIPYIRGPKANWRNQ